ncbi:MAG: type IV pilus twitching motility protein PilT [candidate division NC10 bacterium]|nr:type IV pilus twitching motility protein PilT [candidate division NC10 bacterium]
MDLRELLKIAVERKASDLHIKVGSSPVIRVDNRLIPLTEKPRVSQEDALRIISSVMNEEQRETFKEKHEIDLAYSVQGLGRFRANVFQQRSTIGMVMRVIPMKIDSIEELNLPPVVEKLAMETRGLILVTGATGTGKTSTLATMVEHMNVHRTAHIITIEDPIEYLVRDKKCLVNQREVGTDTDSFAEALRSALRQDPDVILVGEMRDYETISTAILAAETGHLVLSTLHTVDATETINRIISVFPPYQQRQVRLQLASLLKGIISMRLIPRADGRGRVPAVEIMVATATMRECIVDSDRTRKIPDFIAAGHSQYGMQTFDQSLMILYKRGLITFEEALLWASNPDDFALRARGIEPTWDQQGLKDSEEHSKVSGLERLTG